MSDSVDLTQFNPVIEAFLKLLQSDIAKIALSPDYIQKARVYTTAQMDKGFKAGADIKENEVRIIRGQTWRGWAQRSVKKYGSIVVDGTRFYMRKWSVDEADKMVKKFGDFINQPGGNGSFRTRVAGLAIAEWSRNVRNRPFEKVWRKRGPKGTNKRYSETSKMMQNDRTMQLSIINMKFSVVGQTIVFEPGATVEYLKYQNAMRPFFIWDNPVDEPKLAELLVQVAQEKMKALNK